MTPAHTTLSVSVEPAPITEAPRLPLRSDRPSDMAEDIISYRLGFGEKWGLMIFVTVLLLMLCATWFIRYPDIIQARAMLSSENAPKEIVTVQAGRLVKLFAQNNEKVKKGQVWGVIESTASYAEVLDLSARLDGAIGCLNAGQPKEAATMLGYRYTNLGDIQPAYQQLITAWQLFNDYISNGFYARKKSSLTSDLQTLEAYRKTVEEQRKLTEQDLQLTKESHDANKTLLDEKIISREEYRLAASKYLNRQLALPQLQASLLSNESQKRDKIKELDILDHDMSQQQTTFRQMVESVKSVVDEWKRKFLLQAPTDGKLVFVGFLQENQFIAAGRLLAYVSNDNNRFYMQMVLPQANFGKIDTGLQVQIRFDAYPYQEMGFVKGTLNFISPIATDSGFVATIRLDSGLVTNTRKLLFYRSGLNAQAVVITRDMRLLQRFIYSFRKDFSVANQ